MSRPKVFLTIHGLAEAFSKPVDLGGQDGEIGRMAGFPRSQMHQRVHFEHYAIQPNGFGTVHSMAVVRVGSPMLAAHLAHG